MAGGHNAFHHTPGALGVDRWTGQELLDEVVCPRGLAECHAPVLEAALCSVFFDESCHGCVTGVRINGGHGFMQGRCRAFEQLGEMSARQQQDTCDIALRIPTACAAQYLFHVLGRREGAADVEQLAQVG